MGKHHSDQSSYVMTKTIMPTFMNQNGGFSKVQSILVILLIVVHQSRTTVSDQSHNRYSGIADICSKIKIAQI